VSDNIRERGSHLRRTGGDTQKGGRPSDFGRAHTIAQDWDGYHVSKADIGVFGGRL
jgi:hypothetical protein